MSLATFHDCPAAPLAADGQPALAVDVLRSPEAVQQIWAALTATGTATPYQSSRWISAYLAHVDAPGGAAPAFMVLKDQAGVPLMLLPLVVQSHGGVRVARFIGGKHSNFNAPLFAPQARALQPVALRAALLAGGRQCGIDLFHFINQPLDWQGTANPLAGLPAQPSPSAGYKFALAPDAEAVLKAQLSKDTRKKLRQKEGKLAEIGPVRYVKPAPGAEAQAMLSAFLALKAARFKDQGIDDPFAGADVQAFLEAVTEDGTLEFHALMVGERPAAIYAGVADASRFCGVVTAFDAAPEIARSSPGDILLTYMVRDMCARGLETFDLGVGEAHYKSKICDQSEPLVDTLLPVTLAGRLAGTAFGWGGDLKRWLKQSPTGQKMITGIRKLKTRA